MKKSLTIAEAICIILLGLTIIKPIASAPDPSPKGMIFSSDDEGNKRDSFLPTEDVCVYGVGLVGNAEYMIYIVYDTTMKDGDTIPTYHVTTTGPITTDGSGSFGPTTIWSAPLTPGYYDIIADCQDKGTPGTFDRETDAEDTIEASNMYGFFVIPEVQLGTIGVLLASFTATIIKRKRIL